MTNCFFNDFVFNDATHKVNIMWEDDEPLFEANQIGDILEMGNIHSSISKLPSEVTRLHSMEGGNGIRNKTFLTEFGLYELLLKSRKPIAKTFKTWVLEVIKSIRKTGKYELENAQRVIADLKVKAENATHNSLIEAFSDKYIVYVGLVKEIGDKKLIKIGSTKNIKNRFPTLVEEFGSISFLKAYECEANEQFEKYLHKHKKISKHAYREPIHNGHRSTEVFLMTDDEIDGMYRIMKAVGYKYKTGVVSNAEEESRDEDIATLKQEVTELKSELKSNLSETANNKTELIIDNSTIKKRKFTNGKKVQIYSQDGKTLIKTYDTSLDAQVDPKLDSPTGGCINKAVEEKTIYKGYRWALLDREEDERTVQEIGETVVSKKVNIGFVAMLNLDKNKIENVFPDSKEAAKDRKFRSGAPISKAIRQGTQSGGHYFKMWFDCDDELKEEYLKNNTLPIKSIPNNAITIEKLHPVNKEVIETFASINDIQKSLRCGRKLIKDAIELENVCKGYYWRLKT